MTRQRVFGVETEYAVTPVSTDGSVIPTPDLAGALLRAAERLLPSLPGAYDVGLFLGNGSRMYVDAGAHPEIAGPECLDPWDVVRYLRAGDRILERLAEDVRERNPVLAEARLFTGNVDYSGTGSTWGSHESYGHRADPDLIRRCLVPHLVTRVIFSGAGGFNPCSGGLEFTLSPRAHQLTHVVSDESTHDRGIAHTRDEPLAAHGYRRQHLICGESLRSDVAAWLRVGTTALVVALIDGGVVCGGEVGLRSPLEALHDVAGDPSCQRPLRLTRGGTATAIEVQRHFLACARAHQHASFMPPWTGEVCERWGEMLDRLTAGPERVSTMLDWAIKLAIYRARARRHGFHWESLPAWSRLLNASRRPGVAVDQPSTAPPAAAPPSTGERLQGAAEARVPEQAGRPRSQLDRVRALRHELLEVDVRWGMLGAGGLFDELDRAGVLDHRVPGVDRVDEAVEHPPAAGRARVRGMTIHRLWRDRGRYACDWDHVWDLRSHGSLDLTDPLIDTEVWHGQGSIVGEFQRLLWRVRPPSRRSPPPDRGGS